MNGLKDERMTNEQAIKLISYCSNQDTAIIKFHSSRSDRIPKLRTVGSSKDECVFTWNAEKPNQIEAYHYDISYHNSDHYNRETEVINIDDETVDQIKEVIVKELAISTAYKDEDYKERAIKAKNVVNRVESAMEYGKGARFVSLQSDKRIEL